MTSTGRPSKLTPETIKTLTNAIGLGASYVDACKAAGIDYSTFAKWRQKAEGQSKGEYFDFFNALAVEEAAATLRHLAVINNAAAKGDWKASLEWLKRRRRGDWGDNATVDVNHKGNLDIGIKQIDYRNGVSIPATGSGDDSSEPGEN